MLTIIGAIFSSIRIYLVLGAVMLVMAVGAYIFYLRAEASAANAALATAQATISEARDALATDDKTIGDLQRQNEVAQQAIVAAQTSYGEDVFAAAIELPNLLACQFHPEKSQDAGLRIIRNFLTR